MKFTLVILTALLFAGSAHATTRCYSDGYGNTTCRDSNGNTTRGYSDGNGNSTWRDSNGNTTRCYDDGYGNTTCR